MNNLGWFRGTMAKMVVAARIGLAGGFGTIVVHAAASPSTTAPTTPSPGSGSGTMKCPNM